MSVLTKKSSNTEKNRKRDEGEKFIIVRKGSESGWTTAFGLGGETSLTRSPDRKIKAELRMNGTSKRFKTFLKEGGYRHKERKRGRGESEGERCARNSERRMSSRRVGNHERYSQNIEKGEGKLHRERT